MNTNPPKSQSITNSAPLFTRPNPQTSSCAHSGSKQSAFSVSLQRINIRKQHCTQSNLDSFNFQPLFADNSNSPSGKPPIPVKGQINSNSDNIKSLSAFPNLNLSGSSFEVDESWSGPTNPFEIGSDSEENLKEKDKKDDDDVFLYHDDIQNPFNAQNFNPKDNFNCCNNKNVNNSDNQRRVIKASHSLTQENEALNLGPIAKPRNEAVKHPNPIPPKLQKMIHHSPDSVVYKVLKGSHVRFKDSRDLMNIVSYLKAYEIQCNESGLFEEMNYVQTRISQLIECSQNNYSHNTIETVANQNYTQIEYQERRKRLVDDFNLAMFELKEFARNQNRAGGKIESIREQEDKLCKQHEANLKTLDDEYNAFQMKRRFSTSSTTTESHINNCINECNCSNGANNGNSGNNGDTAISVKGNKFGRSSLLFRRNVPVHQPRPMADKVYQTASAVKEMATRRRSSGVAAGPGGGF